MRELDWYPKPTGAGDIDGAGSKRLLGQPELDIVNLVVRETAQNSWDARLDDVEPSVSYRTHTLGPEQMRLLRTVVFPRHVRTRDLGQALLRSRMDVLEIADRGTTGLAGVLRNDRDLPGPRNWCDFVLSVGAPQTRASSGGTYGFGKTATYQASACATILIWTVTRHESQLQHRFIASAMDDGFVVDGRRYTGRQWWGRLVGEWIEPVVGAEARQLGEALFEAHFAPGETGTSIMVLDPRPVSVADEDADLPSTWEERLPQAIVRNLWPKLIPGQDRRNAMDIRVLSDGQEVRLPGADSSPTLAALQRALAAVRGCIEGSSTADDPMTQYQRLRCLRPKEDRAVIALAQYIRQDTDPFNDLAQTITMMRAPELVVRALPHPVRVDELLGWVAVLKPMPGMDRSFAMSEPPAHDNWAAESVDSKPDKARVSFTLKRAKDAVNQWLKPTPVAEQTVEVKSTATVATAFAALAGVATGARPSSGDGKSSRRSSGPRSRSGAPKIEVTRAELLPASAEDLTAGRERSRLHFQVSGLGQEVDVFASRLAVVFDGGYDRDVVQVEGWTGPDGELLGEAPRATVPMGRSLAVDVSYPAGVAIDVMLAVGSES